MLLNVDKSPIPDIFVTTFDQIYQSTTWKIEANILRIDNEVDKIFDFLPFFDAYYAWSISSRFRKRIFAKCPRLTKHIPSIFAFVSSRRDYKSIKISWTLKSFQQSEKAFPTV